MPNSPTFKNFNPTGNATVAAIKEATDKLISLVESIEGNGATQRRKAIAITNYEQAAMWAVKSLFSEDD